MKLKVLFHDNCFDGAASAAVFSRFYLERINPSAELAYEGLAHQAGGKAIDESLFSGDENAIVDFRYSQSPRLTWWFDHHRSAFQVSGDGAQFASPEAAVEIRDPALQVMTVLEANRDPDLTRAVIKDMQHLSLEQIANSPAVSQAFRPLLAKHQKSIEVVRRKAQFDRGVVFFDVVDESLDSLNKFISYYLYPQAQYSVWIGGSPQRTKVSIGSNPWKPEGRTHDLSRVAERYGGGGHAVVAGISFRPNEVEKARKAAAEIAAVLKG